MAGHSQFKNIMHRKGAQDKKRAALFARLTREIMVATRAGLPDPESNARLRTAMQAARQANMPKDNIARAIRRAAGGEDGTRFEEVRYEGYGAGGAAILLEALTDNRNRTAGEIRMLFSKHGGTLGESNSVAYLFSHCGEIRLEAKAVDGDKLLEVAIDAGAEDCALEDQEQVITCAASDLAAVTDALSQDFAEALLRSGLVWRTLTAHPVADEDQAKSLLSLLEALEESEDVRAVYSNCEIAAPLLERLGLVVGA